MPPTDRKLTNVEIVGGRMQMRFDDGSTNDCAMPDGFAERLRALEAQAAALTGRRDPRLVPAPSLALQMPSREVAALARQLWAASRVMHRLTNDLAGANLCAETARRSRDSMALGSLEVVDAEVDRLLPSHATNGR